MTSKITFGQTIFDFCVWKYGTLQQISKLVSDNSLNYGSDIEAGDELVYSSGFGNEDIISYLAIEKIIPVNNNANIREINNFVFKDGNNFIFKDGHNFIFKI